MKRVKNSKLKPFLTLDLRFAILEIKSKIGNQKLKILCLVACILLVANGEAAVKRQRVTVGMFNTYSTGDGNLGRSEPDLKEVWEGVPDVSDFEACNVTMHYWPRPGDLPSVEPGENPYSAWWSAYMEEAYNLTNQNGEVRLRVVVGPLYSYYTAYKGGTFDKFVEDLCRWEKDSIYAGTLAGWYLTEEPTGSSHNFDPEVCNEMARAIKTVENSVGTRHHTMYIDISVDGMYYSQSSLAAFTRPADVVMISSSTYIWTTNSRQPVYEPIWKTIHGPMKQVRDIVYSDRRRREMPRPEIHVVLEARDAIGHGQPTNWEMRQQIHIALSQSHLHNDPPADGVWFFWWSEIARNAKDNSDDWNYGRRIAEAIQTQVARSTYAESPWVKKDYDPDETQFRFPEFGSFNPTNSCIPYDLAEPGYVRIEVLDDNLSFVRDFDMKYQVAGSLRRFGGPYWHRGDAPNGFYIFRLYLNSKLADEVKVKVQWSIMLNSASHQLGVWSNNNVIDVQWEPQTEDVAGLAGYSILWDTSRNSYPNSEKDVLPAVTSLRSDPLPDSDSNYFHIRSVDRAGNWSTAVHLGPFYIDTTEPGIVKDPTSDSHEIGKWSRNNRVNVHWNPAQDASSGIKGYSVLWDGAPGALPDEKIDVSDHETVLASEPLDDGRYYFHIRSVDNTGNWASTAAHAGPFLIDTSPPGSVTDLMSNSYMPGQWSRDDTVIVSWKAADDLGSGIDGYSILWDDFVGTMPDNSMNMGKKTSAAISPPLESGGDHAYYFHIRSVDNAGNWTPHAQHLGPFMIDTEPPPKIEGLVSTSHKPDEWSPQTSVDITWAPGKDDVSGIAGYEWRVLWDTEIRRRGDTETRGHGDAETWEFAALPFQPPLHIPQLGDGLWYIHVRAVDKAGNIGVSENIMVKIDSAPPAPPAIWSSSHPDDGVWYTNPEPILEWSAEDKTSGIDGYSWLWDTEAVTTPDEVEDVLGQGEGDTETRRGGDAETRRLAASPPLRVSLRPVSASFFAPSPGIWYFHLRAVDKAGNWSEPSHYKVQVDPSAPSAPQIGSDTHRNGGWIARSDVRLSWETTAPGPSGIAGYSCSLDRTSDTLPDDVSDGIIDQIAYSVLSDGVWYFHCRAKSGSGLWGPAAHYEIMIDTSPPEISITYPRDNKWYMEPITEYSGTVNDGTSGIEWNSFEYNHNGGPWTPFHSDTAENWSDQDEIPHCSEADGDTLRVRVRDKAGNYAVSDLTTIRVDRSISRPVIVSSTHPDQDKWYAASDPDFAWDFSDSVSGADGYSWTLDHSEATIPPPIRMIEGHITFKTDIADLSDGSWYFHLRGRDMAGNWSEPSHYIVKIDSTPPTAKLKISGPAVLDARYREGEAPAELYPASIIQYPPLVRSGPVEVLLQASETILEPVLEYRPASATSPIPIELIGSQIEGGSAGLLRANEWSGSFGMTVHTGDGEAVFLFSARDEAGNTGSEITAGRSFIVDTLVRADADEAMEVLCVAEPGTKISLPSGAITQDLRIEVIKNAANLASNVIAIYDFVPYDSRMRKLKDLTFRAPVEITFSEPISPLAHKPISLYYWDEVKWHKVQDTWMTMRVDYLGRFALMKSEPISSDIIHGWAAPNPFTPNGSGDTTDRTIFYVATKTRSADFTVSIYDINGRLVKRLEGGRRTWDGTDEDGRVVEGGLYIYQIQSKDQIVSGTVVVLK